MTPWAAIVEEIRAEKRKGASALVRRAAEAFRLLANALPSAGDDWHPTLTDASIALATVRPAFAGLTRLATAALDAADPAMTPGEAARALCAAVDGFTAGLDHDAERIVARAARLLGEQRRRVLTISASSLVERALLGASTRAQLQVVCLESRPMLEGTALACRLAEAGLAVTLTLDALGPTLAREVDLVLVGGDTLAPPGLLHKVGTFGVALAARQAGVPVYALVGPEKLLPALPSAALSDGGTPDELLSASTAAGRPHGLRVQVPYFDLTPLDLLAGVVMPDGIVSAADAAERARSVRLHPRIQKPIQH
jgi:translation initiation factor 2B subunit (eIF-2B alpha/beta/delta family)